MRSIGALFAPALEHGKGSNEKQYDCDGAKNFQQHDPTLLVSREATRDDTRTNLAANFLSAQ